jgi:hypothetical protein
MCRTWYLAVCPVDQKGGQQGQERGAPYNPGGGSAYFVLALTEFQGQCTPQANAHPKFWDLLNLIQKVLNLIQIAI